MRMGSSPSQVGHASAFSGGYSTVLVVVEPEVFGWGKSESA